jgi:hypothetical protein
MSKRSSLGWGLGVAAAMQVAGSKMKRNSNKPDFMDATSRMVEADGRRGYYRGRADRKRRLILRQRANLGMSGGTIYVN